MAQNGLIGLVPTLANPRAENLPAGELASYANYVARLARRPNGPCPDS